VKEKDILKLVAHSDLPGHQVGQVLEECGENRFDTLKDGATEEFGEQLSDNRIVEFVNFIKGQDDVDHSALIELGNLLREYGKSSENPKKLNQREIDIIDLGVSFFNKWYPSGIKKLAQNGAEKSANSLAAAAFLANQLAKIRLIQNGEAIEDLDKSGMLSYIDKTKATIERYFDKEYLSKRLSATEDEWNMNEQKIKKREETEKPISVEISKLKKLAVPAILTKIDTLLEGTEKYKDVARMFAVALRANNAKVLEYMIRNNTSLGVAWDRVGDPHTMRMALDGAKKLTVDERKKIMSLSEITGGPEIAEKFRILDTTDSVQDLGLDDKQIALTERMARMRDVVNNRESIMRDAEESLATLRKSILTQRAGGFYGLKTLLVSLKMMLDAAKEGNESIDFYSKRLSRDRSRIGVHTFSFYENDMTSNPAWYKMHVKRNHILGASFVIRTILENAENK
jgi:hypothetical protein